MIQYQTVAIYVIVVLQKVVRKTYDIHGYKDKNCLILFIKSPRKYVCQILILGSTIWVVYNILRYIFWKDCGKVVVSS